MGTKYRDGVEYHGAFPAQVIQSLITDICDMVYPVGCYFETTDTDFNPNEVFVGTWVLEAEGLVHVSSGTNYTVTSNDQDGGAIAKALILNNLPGRTVVAVSNSSGSTKNTSNAGWAASNVTNGAFTATSMQDAKNANIGTSQGITTTGDVPFNVMQPYKIVNRWYRTE